LNWGLQALVIMPETGRVKIKSRGAKLDFTQTAAAVVSQSIGEGLFDGKPLPDPHAGKEAKVVERGRQGGLKGGEARAKKLTPIAKHPRIIYPSRWLEFELIAFRIEQLFLKSCCILSRCERNC
jgi:hypothetical protein